MQVHLASPSLTSIDSGHERLGLGAVPAADLICGVGEAGRPAAVPVHQVGAPVRVGDASDEVGVSLPGADRDKVAPTHAEALPHGRHSLR